MNRAKLYSKAFAQQRKNMSKVKRQPSEWEGVRANKAADQEINSKI